MPVTRGLGTTGDSAGTVTPLDHKLAQSGLVTKQGLLTNLVRPGLFWDDLPNIVGARANMAYDVRPFTAVLSRGAAAGTVLLSNDGVVQVATTAAPGSNSRIDVVYVWQREFSLDGVNSNPVIGVLQGTAAVSPVAPSLAAFPGAIELARVTVPAGITATTSATITQSSRFTAAAGGVLYFRNAAERDEAVSLVPDGTVGFVKTTRTLWLHDNGAWVLMQQDTRTVFKRTTGTIASGGSYIALPVDTAVVGADFTRASNVYTCQVAGEYKVRLVANFAGGSSTGRRGVRLLGSGAVGDRISEIAAPASTLNQTLSVEFGSVTLAVNDTVTAQGVQASGGSITVLAELLFERIV